MDRNKEKIRQAVEKPLLDEGCFIVDIVLSSYKGNHTVRLFVYAKDKTSLSECARISRIVGDLIDGTDLFKSGYTLEVSSPGLDRPLTTIDDFEYRIGETVKVLFADQSRKYIKAKIVSAGDNKVEFLIDDNQLILDLAEIEKAKIVF